MSKMNITELLAELQSKIEAKAAKPQRAATSRAPANPEMALAKALKREFRSIMNQLGGFKRRRHPKLLYKRPMGEGAIAKAWTHAINVVENDVKILKNDLAKNIVQATGVALSSANDIAYKVRRYLALVEEGFYTSAGEITPEGAKEVKEFNAAEEKRAAEFAKQPRDAVDVDALKARLQAIAAQTPLPLADEAEAEEPEDDEEEEEDVEEDDDAEDDDEEDDEDDE
jgi:hypothetical protein